MHEYILRNWRIVKVATTKAQRKLFFNLRSQKKSLGWLSAEETRAIAADLGVDEAEVTRMEGRLSGRDIAFDAPADSDEEDSWQAPQYFQPTGKWIQASWLRLRILLRTVRPSCRWRWAI